MRDSPLAPEVRGFVACGAVVRRDALLACGGFEPRFQFGGEEELLALDLAAAGWRLHYADDVVAHHAPADDERDGRDFRDLRNAVWTAWLRWPAVVALARTRSVLADLGASAPVVLGAALRGLPWILRRRRVVPPRIEREFAPWAGSGPP
jgi:N-acetylglucosaminyl-diphospho-decaprenol L-rhamnosyltransferase